MHYEENEKDRLLRLIIVKAVTCIAWGICFLVTVYIITHLTLLCIHQNS